MYREFPQWEFNVYFVAPIDPALIPGTPEEQWAVCMNTPGCVELTWNYGSETEEGRVYNTGNSDATGSSDGEKVRGGFGHLGITVPDVYEACQRFQDLGCEFSKTPNGGGMKGLGESIVLFRAIWLLPPPPPSPPPSLRHRHHRCRCHCHPAHHHHHHHHDHHHHHHHHHHDHHHHHRRHHYDQRS